jgi:putative transposase
VGNKAAHLAVGIDVDGDKHVLGIWIEAIEGAKCWIKVCNELRSRGVKDVLAVVCDGLKGFPEASESVWPHAWVQTCIVHLMRNSLNPVSYQDRKMVAATLKAIYRAPDEQAAWAALKDFEAARGQRYPGIPRMWRDAWEQVIPFLAFPPETRKVMDITNAIESINYKLRKVTKNRGHFPNDDALMKLLYLAVRNMEKKGRRGMGVAGTYNWKAALNQFHIFFPKRLEPATARR